MSSRRVALPDPARRKPGGWEGKVWVADNFDAALPAPLLAAFSGKRR